MSKHVIMEEELHTKLKIRASAEKKSIKGIVAKLVKNYLKENKEIKE